MISVIIFLTVWLAFGLVIYHSVKCDARNKIPRIGRRIIFWVLTAPVLWYGAIAKGIEKYVLNDRFSFLAKVKDWFLEA